VTAAVGPARSHRARRARRDERSVRIRLALPRPMLRMLDRYAAYASKDRGYALRVALRFAFAHSPAFAPLRLSRQGPGVRTPVAPGRDSAGVQVGPRAIRGQEPTTVTLHETALAAIVSWARGCAFESRDGILASDDSWAGTCHRVPVLNVRSAVVSRVLLAAGCAPRETLREWRRRGVIVTVPGRLTVLARPRNGDHAKTYTRVVAFRWTSLVEAGLARPEFHASSCDMGSRPKPGTNAALDVQADVRPGTIG
jgi:hypothetical protein